MIRRLARYSNNPQSFHWKAAKRVIKYLKGTIDVSLYFCGESSDELIGYCDSDYVGELKERRSTSGYIFLIHGGLIAWALRLQQIIALSLSEAEYMSILEALKELLWLRLLMQSIGLRQTKPTELKVDNQAAIAMSKSFIKGLNILEFDFIVSDKNRKLRKSTLHMCLQISKQLTC